MTQAPDTTGWLELTLDFSSNLRCIGCFACDPSAGAAMDLAEVSRWLQWGRGRGLRHLWLGGGEPTLRPDLGKIVRGARKLGYETVLLQTNGMRLSHERYADAVLTAGVDVVSLNLKSADPALHDRLSGRPGVFDLLARAVDVLATRDVRVVADVLLTRSTLPGLEATVRWFASKGVDRFWLWLLSAADSDAPDVRAEVPAPEELVGPLAAATRAAEELGVELKSLHTPPCWLPAGERAVAWSARELDLWVANPGQPQPMRLEASTMEGGAWLPGCDTCAERARCGGPRPDSLELFGEGAFTPIPRAVSNSFHYVLDRVSRPWPEGAPCPRLQGPDADEGARLLYVHRGGRLIGASTTTTDFTPPQVATVKDGTKQVYLDISDKAAPDDFAADLRRLVEHAACGECERRARCGRAFVPVETDVFNRDDRAVRHRIDALRGDVLDIGAGHGPYVEQLQPLAEGGQIRYRAVEPDAEHASILQTRAPWADVQVATAEALALAPTSLDHALVLRSYNHLHDPGAVVRQLTDALRPGGRLLVVDNVAFALVRSSDQASRAEQGPAIFEHTRNDGAADHVALVERLGLPLQLTARQDVSAETSNQWLVEWERVSRVDSSP